MENLIEKYRDKLPDSYLDFIAKNEGFRGYIEDELGFVALWDLNELHEAWGTLEIGDNLSEDWFPIGSNGGGEMIAIKLSSPAKVLYFIPFITQSEKDADFYCDDFSILYQAIKRYRKS